MFKPLLRTLPSLSGNMKIVCMLNNYNEVEEHVFEANVRSAQLKPLSSQLYNKYYTLSLLSSSYEWDVRSFYKKYSEYFYKTLFDINKIDMPLYVDGAINNVRNTDFEFGCKRVSYQKSYKQFGFYAPIYIESENDIPDYFEINIDLINSTYKANRKIRVNVLNKYTEGGNYIGKYIYDYAKKIDDNVIHCDLNRHEGIYYGIDVIQGGFSTKHDSNFQSLFNKQNSILNFDNIICKGFERNKLIMKQVIPLSFYFSVNDILSDIEKETFFDSELKISGKWFKDGKESDMYDFEFDYTTYKPNVKTINTENGSMIYRVPFVSNEETSSINIMNIGFPSMRELLFYKYRFANKVSPNFSRWKLKYSDDENPYVTNMSGAFSIYQNSKTKYGEFPNLYSTLIGAVNKRPYYLNLFFPLNGGETKYSSLERDKYIDTRNKYCSDWFELFESIEDVYNKCKSVNGNKVYFNGILYDLNRINDCLPFDKQFDKIDKFGVFVRPVFHFISDEEIRNELIYTNYAILKQGSDYIKNRKANCHVSDTMLSSNKPIIFSNIATQVNDDYLSENDIFIANKNDDGDFISLAKYGIDWYESNTFYRLNDLQEVLNGSYVRVLDNLINNTTYGFELLPIHRLSNVINKQSILTKDYSSERNALYMSIGSNGAKIPIEEDTIINGEDLETKFILYNRSFYRSSQFINRDSLEDIVATTYTAYIANAFPALSIDDINKKAMECTYRIRRNVLSGLLSYQFHPVMKSLGGITYASKVFTCEAGHEGRFYGNEIPGMSNRRTLTYDAYPLTNINTSTNSIIETQYKGNAVKNVYTYLYDNNFIYVDPWRLNNIISHYNNAWLARDEKLAYLVNYETINEKPLNGTRTSFDYYYPFIMENDKPIKIPGGKPILKEHEELIAKICKDYINIIPVAYDTNNYCPQIIVFTNREKTQNFKINVSSIENKDGSESTIYNSIEKVNELIETKTEIINGEEISTMAIFIAKGLLGKYIEIDEEVNLFDEYRHIGDAVEILFSTLYIQDTFIDWTKYGERYDILNTSNRLANPVIKFLNHEHFVWYCKEISSTKINYNTPISDEERLNNIMTSIFIRKRFLDSNKSVVDYLIPVKTIFNFQNYNQSLNTRINNFVNLIGYDEETGLFYFNELKYKNGKIYKFNTENTPIYIDDLLCDSKDFVRNIIVNNKQVEIIESKKLQFELVFKKPLVKVDENIWRLINLDEKYAAPYKDLYLYEIEKPSEYNPNIYIAPLQYNEELSYLKDSPMIDSGTKLACKDIEIVYPSAFKPMFNLVTIETKDGSKVYTEYSVNNITESKFYDTEIMSYIDGAGDIHGKDYRIFYRHNCNNEVGMYDLSTIDKSLPLTIHGSQYVYKKYFPNIHDEYNSTQPSYKWKYFHDTFDLFTYNDCHFTNYYDVEETYIPVGTEDKTIHNIVPVIGTYNSTSFEKIYPNLYKDNLWNTEYGDKIIEDNRTITSYGYLTSAGNWYDISYIDLQDGDSYIVKRNNPTKPTEYIVTNYKDIVTYQPVEIFAYTYTYNYYNSLDLYDNFNLSTCQYINEQGDTYTYAFYLIDVEMNNTTNTFNVVSYEGDYIKYISYINSVKLSKDTEIINNIYKNVVPYIKSNPLRYFESNAYTLIKPKIFDIPLNYHPIEVKNTAGKLCYYDIKFEKGVFGNMICERYFDDIVPIIKPINSVITYNLKFKNAKKSFRPTYFTNEVIYRYENTLNNYPGIRVYDTNTFSKYELKYDMEYKHFNANKMYNLEEKFTYIYEDNLTKSEVAIAESNVRVYSVFKDYMMSHYNSKLDDDGIKWAFSKYKVEFGCDAVKLSESLDEKLYHLEIYFELY